MPTTPPPTVPLDDDDAPQQPLPAAATLPQPPPEPGPPEPPIDPIPGVMHARAAHLLVGGSGSGKTPFLVWFVQQLLEKDRILRWPLDPRPLPFIAYISGDRGCEGALELFQRADIEIPYYSLAADRELGTLRELSRMHSRAKKSLDASPFPLLDRAIHHLRDTYFPGAPRLPVDSLLIIDAALLFLGLSVTGQDLAIAAGLNALQHKCDQEQLTVISSHYEVKRTTTHPKMYAHDLDHTAGSMVVQQGHECRMQIMAPQFTTHPREGLHAVKISPRTSAPLTAWMQLGPDGLFTLPEAWDREPDDTTSTMAAILQALALADPAVGIPRALLREKLGISRATFTRVLSALVDRGQVKKVRVGKLIYLTLVPGTAAKMD